MTNKEVYKIWAPFGKKWVDWVRPVPFIPINNKTETYQPSLYNLDIMFPSLSDLNKNETSTAIIVDFPNNKSVEVGLLLAKHYGYRPIPIHNGVLEQEGARATTDNRSIASALLWGATILSKEIEIKDDAPPVFLTDTNRLQRYRIDDSIFDNSWDVYHQDLPSEDYFLQNGITKIVVIGNSLSKDLKKIFKDYPHKKLQIYFTDGYTKLKCIRKGK